MKILITGAGLIGDSLAQKLKNKNNVLVVSRTIYPGREYKIEGVDLTEYQKMDKLMASFKPDVVIHTAAVTDVDLCEKDKNLAKKINADATEVIAKLCKQNKSKLVYISTSFVFDGKKSEYSEDDIPNPVNYYGKTKLLGEEAVKKICFDYCIIRTDQPYGWVKEGIRDNFVTGILKKLDKEAEIKIFDDWFNNPTNVNNFSDAATELLDKRGIFHVVGSEYISRYKWALKIAEVFGKDKNRIKPSSSSSVSLPAKRPNARLSIEKVRNIIKTKLLNVEAGLGLMKKEG